MNAILAFIETLLPDVIRYVGWAALKVVTLGRYRGSRERDGFLLEGVAGFAIVVAVAFVVYRWPAGAP